MSSIPPTLSLQHLSNHPMQVLQCRRHQQCYSNRRTCPSSSSSITPSTPTPTPFTSVTEEEADAVDLKKQKSLHRCCEGTPRLRGGEGIGTQESDENSYTLRFRQLQLGVLKQLCIDLLNNRLANGLEGKPRNRF